MSKREFFISKKVGRATTDYRMMKNKDRILVAVSGGKDSLALLKILKDRQAFVPINYELIAVHINLNDKNASVVRKYLKDNGYTFHIEKPKKKLDSKDPKKPNKNPCFWCSWIRRKALFRLAAKLKCRKIALAHHKDDIIQTQLLNLFFNGEISTMSPMQKMFGGELYLIRPLAYVEEYELARFAEECKFPKLPEKCPQIDITKRRYVKNLISEIRKECPDVKDKIFRSLKRIKKDYLI